MTFTPPQPIRPPTIRDLQADLNSHFGPESVRIIAWSAREIRLGPNKPTLAAYVTGWFTGRHRSRSV